MGKQGLEFIGSKEPSGTDNQAWDVNSGNGKVGTDSYHVCRPTAKAKFSVDVEII
jgi:hypothetical protein